MEDGETAGVVRSNDDIPRLRSKFSQLTSRETRIFRNRASVRRTLLTTTIVAALAVTIAANKRERDDG